MIIKSFLIYLEERFEIIELDVNELTNREGNTSGCFILGCGGSANRFSGLERRIRLVGMVETGRRPPGKDYKKLSHMVSHLLGPKPTAWPALDQHRAGIQKNMAL